MVKLIEHSLAADCADLSAIIEAVYCLREYEEMRDNPFAILGDALFFLLDDGEKITRDRLARIASNRLIDLSEDDAEWLVRDHAFFEFDQDTIQLSPKGRLNIAI